MAGILLAAGLIVALAAFAYWCGWDARGDHEYNKRHLDPYVTKTGKVLTDADIENLADEAERGYDVSHLRPSPPKSPKMIVVAETDYNAKLLAAMSLLDYVERRVSWDATERAAAEYSNYLDENDDPDPREL